MTFTINATTIGEAHEKVVRLIMTGDFNDLLTEDNEMTFEYPEPVNIHVSCPLMEPQSSPALKFGPLSLNEYRDQIMTPKPLVDKPGKPAFSYLYSNLIFDFPSGSPFKVWRETDENGNERITTTTITGEKNQDILGKVKTELMRVDWPVGNGRGDGLNQIGTIISKLSKNPSSRRAVVSLFEPRGHPAMDDPPCLNHIQFMIRNGELNCHALLRSNDMLSAWGGNTYAFSHLQKYVLDALNYNALKSGADLFGIGWLETTSISAHIYWKRDGNDLDEFRKLWK